MPKVLAAILYFSSPYLFTGRLRCADCGFHLHGRIYRKGGWSRVGYVCGGYRQHGAAVCGHHFLPEDVLLPPVLDALEKELQHFDCSEAVAIAKGRLEDSPALAAAEKQKIGMQIQQVQAQMDNLFNCITPATKHIISEKLVQLDKSKTALQQELRNLEEAKQEARASGEPVKKLLELAKQFRTLWGQATLEEKREFLSLFVKSVSIYPKGKKATIHLDSNYLHTRDLLQCENGRSVPFQHRGGGI